MIPTLGRQEVLSRVLDRLEAQTAPLASFELVVVADGAEPDPGATERAIGERPYAVRRADPRRPGASSARNAGVRAATAELILFLDDDVLPAPDLIEEHLAWHAREPAEEVAVLGHVRWARELRVTPVMRWLERGVQFDYPAIEGTDAGWGRFYTANVSLKRALLERSGGFDEERLPYLYEDIDLGYRLNALGLRLLYNRRAVGEHLHEMTLDTLIERMPRLAAAERRFVELHPEIEPYFFNLFSGAGEPGKARSLHVARVVPRWVPWLGEMVWRRVGYACVEALAPSFMRAWDEAGGASSAPASSQASRK